MSNRASYASRITHHASRIALVFVLASATAFSADLIDPTRPVGQRRSAAAPANPASRVTAVFSFGDRRVAVFDGRVVVAGDRFNGIYIEAVQSDGVRFKQDGRVQFARLPSEAARVRQQIDSEEIDP